MASRSNSKPSKPRDNDVHFVEVLAAPRGFVAVFAGADGTLIFEQIGFGAVVRVGGSNTQLFVSMIGGPGGWRPAEVLDGFLGVSAPDPDRAYWTQAAVEQGKLVARDDPQDAEGGAGDASSEGDSHGGDEQQGEDDDDIA